MALAVAAARHDARASPARRGAAVRRGRRPALVAAATRARACARASPTIASGSPIAVAHYVETTGDARGARRERALPRGPAAAARTSTTPSSSPPSRTRRHRCSSTARAALDRSLALGAHGLPLMGTGDWNDGMNRVGERGQGESVWLGWFLHATLDGVRPARRGARRHERAPTLARRMPPRLQAALEREAGTATGIAAPISTTARRSARRRTTECRIDSIAQSWAVISGAADPSARSAGDGRGRPPSRPAATTGCALLFTPPFDKTPLDPGYIKGYPPGIRENGGQYTHAAVWSVMAFAALGEGDKAAELFSLLNPDQPRAHARRRAALQGRALCRRRRRLFGAAACRARRLDLVHRLGRLDVPRRRRAHPRPARGGRMWLHLDPCIPRRGRASR